MIKISLCLFHIFLLSLPFEKTKVIIIYRSAYYSMKEKLIKVGISVGDINGIGLEIILKVNSNVVKVFYHLNSNCPAHKHQYDIILKDNNCFIV